MTQVVHYIVVEIAPNQSSSPKSLVVGSEYIYRGVAVDSPYFDQLSTSFRDIRRGIQQPQVWGLGALRGVTNAYRKTVLGPWWITISTCFFVLSLSYLRLALGGSDQGLRSAIAFVATGFIAFNFVSSAVTSAAGVFSSSQGVSATSALPTSTSMFQTITANTISFAHESLVIVLLIASFGVRSSWRWLEVVAAVCLVTLFHLGLLLWLGPLACRFRDLGPIIGAIQRIAIFLSPVFWSLDQVQTSGHFGLAKWNPYTYFISAFRDPLLGMTHEPYLSIDPLVGSLVIALANLFVGIIVYGYSFPRLTYWATAV